MVTRIKSREVSSDQGALFDLQEITGQVTPPLTSVTELPSAEVNLNTRAYHLGAALDELGVFRKLVGFQKATASDSYYKKSIAERYKSNLGDVIDGAADKTDTSYLKAKRHFATASGHYALISSGLMSEDEAKKFTSREFSKLESTFFGDSEKTNGRSRFKRKLDNQRKISR